MLLMRFNITATSAQPAARERNQRLGGEVKRVCCAAG